VRHKFSLGYLTRGQILVCWHDDSPSFRGRSGQVHVEIAHILEPPAIQGTQWMNRLDSTQGIGVSCVRKVWDIRVYIPSMVAVGGVFSGSGCTRRCSDMTDNDSNHDAEQDAGQDANQDSNQLTDIQGTVKWFDPRKGFGFIVGPDEQDIFVHFTVIEGDGFRVLKDGSPVCYDAEKNDAGWRATKVHAIVAEESEEGTPEVVVPRRTYSRTPRR